MPEVAALIQLEGIAKRFGGVRALGGVSLHVGHGEVLGLVGENGAGKSTLLKVLGGVHKPDDGAIRVDGEPVAFAAPADSLRRGIAFIHQELSVLDNLDVAANVYLGREFSKLGLIDRGRMRREAAKHLERIGLRIDPATPAGDLSIAQQQLVEIARALSLDARVIVMDEPTSSLTLEETDKLLDVVEGLQRDGVAVIYVSHRLGEIERIADRVTCLRDGENAGELRRDADDPKQRITHDNMARLMVGRDLVKRSRGEEVEAGPVVLKLDAVRTRAFPTREITLELRAGEITGMAGLVGAGRSALVQTIFGVEPTMGGRVIVDGDRALRLRSAKDAIAERIFLVPEDRRGRGLLLDFSVRSNTTLPSLAKHATGGLVKVGSETSVAESARERLAVKTESVATPVGNLSGGNQQKVVIGKWLSIPGDGDDGFVPPRVLLLDEPTRGIDVGAKAGIYDLMRRLADEGAAILMVSSDMEEVLAVSDRVAVMRDGVLTGVLARGEATEETIIQLALAGPHLTEPKEKA